MAALGNRVVPHGCSVEQREVGCVSPLENGQALCQVGSEAAVRPLHPQCSGTARLTL